MEIIFNPGIPASDPSHPLQGLKNLESFQRGEIKEALFRTDQNGQSMSDKELVNACFKSVN